MGFTSIWHWLIVLLIVVLVFGTNKLRNIGKDLGTAVHDFKEGLDKGSQSETAQTHSQDQTTANPKTTDDPSSENKSA